jgi:hypothetical protein
VPLHAGHFCSVGLAAGLFILYLSGGLNRRSEIVRANRASYRNCNSGYSATKKETLALARIEGAAIDLIKANPDTSRSDRRKAASLGAIYVRSPTLK